MILTVTPAPAIDWTVSLPTFDLGAVNRASDSVREPSGKGVNVSIALAGAGTPTIAVFPGGGFSGAFMAEALRAMGVSFRMSESGAEVRTNVTLRLEGGGSTKVNDQAAELSGAARQAFREAIATELVGASAVLICGSLPPGLSGNFVCEVVREGHERGLFTVVDSSGPGLAASLSATPSLIKPNVHELAELTGRPLKTLGDVAEAAHEALERGARSVLASLGADGVLYLDQRTVLHGRSGPVAVVNTVGAGDALLAGFMHSRIVAGSTAHEWIATALAWSSSAVSHPRTHFPVPSSTASVSVREPNFSRQLTEPAVAVR